MIISTLKVSSLPRFRGAFASLKHPSRRICNTTTMSKPDHSERTATEPRDPVRNGAAQNDRSEHLLTQWSPSTVAPHGHSQADPGGQPLNSHLPPRHPTVRGKHQGKHTCVIIYQVFMRPWYLPSQHSHLRLIQPFPTLSSLTPPPGVLEEPRLTHPPRDDQFLPGQWLDVFVPGISKPGGFTITSSPSKAQKKPIEPASAAPANGTASPRPDPAQEPYLELAVQKSPDNPPAQYLWRPTAEILHSELRVRVGGSFVWPPPGVQPTVSGRALSNAPPFSVTATHQHQPAHPALASHPSLPPHTPPRKSGAQAN